MAEHGGGGVLRQMIGLFSFGVDEKELKHGEHKLEDFGESVKEIAKGIAAAFAIHEVVEFLDSTVEGLLEVERAANRLGISTEKVEEFQFAAKSLGLEAGALLNSMGRLQVTQEAAIEGNKEASKVFTTMGVSVKDASGHAKSADEIFLGVAESISKIPDPAARARKTVQLFGRQGRELLPILNRGKEGMEELSKRFHELGGPASEELLRGAKENEEAHADLSKVIENLRRRITEKLLPGYTKVVQWSVKLVKAFTDVAQNSNIVTASMTVLGALAAKMALGFAVAHAAVIGFIVGVAAVILIVDDLITLFEGGESLIGETVNKIFGEGSDVVLMESLKAIWHEINEEIKMVFGWLSKITDWYKESVENGLLGALGNIAGGALKFDSGGVHFISAQQRAQDQAEKQYSDLGGYNSKGFTPNGVFGGAKNSFNYSPNVTSPQMSGGVNAPVTIHVTAPAGTDPDSWGQSLAQAVDNHLSEKLQQSVDTTQRGSAQ